MMMMGGKGFQVVQCFIFLLSPLCSFPFYSLSCHEIHLRQVVESKGDKKNWLNKYRHIRCDEINVVGTVHGDILQITYDFIYCLWFFALCRSRAVMLFRLLCADVGGEREDVGCLFSSFKAMNAMNNNKLMCVEW